MRHEHCYYFVFQSITLPDGRQIKYAQCVKVKRYYDEKGTLVHEELIDRDVATPDSTQTSSGTLSSGYAADREIISGSSSGHSAASQGVLQSIDEMDLLQSLTKKL